MLLVAIIEALILGFGAGWFGHMFHVWHKHRWHDSRLRKIYMRVFRKAAPEASH